MAFFGKYYFATGKDGEGREGDFLRLPGEAAPDGEGWLPAADVYETDDGYVILMELAGVERTELELEVIGDSLLIRGRRDEPPGPPKKNYSLLEIHHGRFERRLRLPGRVGEGGAQASLRNGLLRLVLPRGRPDAPPQLAVIRWE